MVSGIGPADILEELDIPAVAHLPGVGQDTWVCVLSTAPDFQVMKHLLYSSIPSFFSLYNFKSPFFVFCSNSTTVY